MQITPHGGVSELGALKGGVAALCDCSTPNGGTSAHSNNGVPDGGTSARSQRL